jgi:hypothetical protein
MIQPDAVPEATAPPEHHADFLELCTLRSRRQSMSVQEFIRDLRIANATEVIADSNGRDEDDEGDEQAEALAQAAFDEIDARRRSFGSSASWYPFEVTPDSLSLRAGGEEALYTFLALLSWYGKDSGPNNTDGEKIFEEISAKAAEAYLGGPDVRVQSFVFGFPRQVEPKGFREALDKLCDVLGEGGGHHRGRPELPNQKDGKLDIVAWVEFADKREGKLITFGQCATGRNWGQKITELPDSGQWCRYWMAGNPTVSPLRSFFVPHRVERDNWTHTCNFGGILYDRCRIASLASEADTALRMQWSNWSAHVLKGIRKAKP